MSQNKPKQKYEELSEQNEYLKRIIQFDNILQNYFEEIIQKDDGEEILDQYLRYLLDIVNIDGYLLYIIDPKTKEFIPRRMNNLSFAHKEHARSNMEKGMFAWAIDMGKPTLIPFGESKDYFSCKTVIMAPLHATRRPIGVLYAVSGTGTDKVTPLDFKNISMLSKQTAIALEKIEYIVEEKALVEERTRAQEHKRYAAALELKNQELREKNTSYMEMLGFVSHELKNPLATVMEYTNLLGEGFLGDLSDDQYNAVGVMGRNLSNINSMIRNYLDLSRLEKGQLHVRKEYLLFKEDILSPVLLDYTEFLNKVDLEPDDLLNNVADNIPIYCDRNLFKIVFSNLISNAIKYGYKGEAIDVAVVQTSKGFSVSVSNKGDQLSDDECSKMFDKFVRLENISTIGEKGTGLGLYITKQIVIYHGGEIIVSCEDNVVTFTISLPLS